MKFYRSNKFDFCYYGQVNSLRIKSSVASKWASKLLGEGVTFILLAMVHIRHWNLAQKIRILAVTCSVFLWHEDLFLFSIATTYIIINIISLKRYIYNFTANSLKY